MKRLTLFLTILSSLTSSAQTTEFGESENGLIYSNSTISQLKKIVDSLNIKFRVCDLNRTYYSKPQTMAHYVSITADNIKGAKDDMEKGLPYENFINKYSEASHEEDLLLVKYSYKDYEGKDVINFSNIALKDGSEHSIRIDTNILQYEKPLKGKWLISYWEGSQYSKESISAFYVVENFTQHAIPEKFARLIQYSDCMVDTSFDVFYDDAERRGRGSQNKTSDNVNAFMRFVHSKADAPVYPEKFNIPDYEIFLEKMEAWEKIKFSKVDSIKSDPRFNKLLIAAVAEVTENGGSHDQFEEYVARYHSKKTALELKRNRRVVGFCSRDDSPRYHAFNIALLSAETINWEIFLRCHLNIMNDRFERNAESSMAKAKRNTYIKELEVLDINVLDLLLGISLRFENANDNHYFGSINRVGRALAESKNPDEFESKMLEMITDCELDTYNRVLMYYLFLNYNDYVVDEDRIAANEEKIKEAVKSLPFYLTRR